MHCGTDPSGIRRGEAWLSGILGGSRAAVRDSYDSLVHQLVVATRRSYKSSPLAGTAYGQADILERTRERALSRPSWLVSSRHVDWVDPLMTLWDGWCDRFSEVLGEVGRRYEQVFDPREGLVPRLVAVGPGGGEAELLREARRVLRSGPVAGAAEDVVSKALLRLLDRGGKEFRGPILYGPDVDESWLRRILFKKVQSVAIDELRSERGRPRSLGGLDPPARGSGGLAEVLEEVFDRLPPCDRDLARQFAAHRLKDNGSRRPYREIAAMIGRTEVEVKQIAGQLRRGIMEHSPELNPAGRGGRRSAGPVDV
jgi:DNA-directed RNA polymerase specialized sigma24 family protein